MSFAGYFLPVLFCMLSILISDSRFDLVWFRLSCDHGWIRSGSVNVRKQQTTTTTRMILVHVQKMYNIFRILIGVPDYSSSSFFLMKRKLSPPPPTNKILRVYYIGIPIQQVKK